MGSDYYNSIREKYNPKDMSYRFPDRFKDITLDLLGIKNGADITNLEPGKEKEEFITAFASAIEKGYYLQLEDPKQVEDISNL